MRGPVVTRPLVTHLLQLPRLCLPSKLLILRFRRQRGKGRMSGLERGERLQIMLTADELEAVENWRFTKRMPSRAAAVRELLRRGLSAEGFLTAESGAKSTDFGLLKPGGNGLGRGAGPSPGDD